MSEPKVSLGSACAAEVVGTFILIFVGLGAVHAAVLTGAHSGLWQVSIVWGIGVTLAIYVVGNISGAHINPAMTLALAVWASLAGAASCRTSSARCWAQPWLPQFCWFSSMPTWSNGRWPGE